MPLHLCAGADIPPLLRHHQHPRSYALTKPWRPITNRDIGNKPQGGASASPALLPEGKWRPIPRRSAWTQWCEYNGYAHWIDGRWQTQLFPDPHATFVVIDSAADARALYEEFPYDDNPLALLFDAVRPTDPDMQFLPAALSSLIHWPTALGGDISGVWLTERGQSLTRHPGRGIPCLDGWDVATVWFSRPAFRVGATWPSPRTEPDWHEVNGAAFAASPAELKEEFARAGEEPPPWLDRLEASP